MPAAEASGIGCPQCGGPLDFSEGSRTTVCGSCRTPLAVTGAAGITRYYLDDTLDLAEARTAARRFLTTKGVDVAVVTQLRFDGGELCFLPFWRLRGHAVGWQWLERETVVVEEYVDEQGITRQREVKGPLERDCGILALPVDYSSPACDLSPYGLAGIATVSSVLTLKGMAYDRLARRGTVFDPAKEAEQVRREAVGLLRERSRQKGTLRRILTTPTRKATYIFGTIFGQVVIALAQMALLVGFGILVMKLNWAQNIPALIVMLVAGALAAAALGTMLGTFVKSAAQAQGLSIMLGMVMALMGGCWYPLELFPQAVRTVVKILPTTWAMQGLLDIVSRGQDLMGILPEAGVLFGFAALFFGIGIWRFKYE